jgi:short-subunit dehydrogenase
MRKALITGASSGIGKEMAFYLDKLDYQLFLVGRDYDSLRNVALKCKNAEAIPMDLSKQENCLKLYDKLKDEDIEVLVNDAGFGLFGYFDETDLNRELDMINVNVIALHILTKLFLKDMTKNNKGYILNVASSAGFLAGPYLSTYYASKNYALKLTMAINEELRQRKSNVVISALCPGPVETGFNRVAGGHFNTKSLDSKTVAKYAIDQMFKKKMIIIPSFKMKFFIFGSRFISYRTLLKLTYKIQKNKTE